MNKAWFIDYKRADWDHNYIVIHAPDKAEARKMLKRHIELYTTPEQRIGFCINHITEWNVNNVPDDWKELPEEGDAYAST